MFGRFRIPLSVFVLLSILAACSPAAPVDLATPPASSTAEGSVSPQETTTSEPSPAPLGFECRNVQGLPMEECQALVALYESTNGANWLDHSGWLDDAHPCGWYGVSCQDGHVIELTLYNNNLAGSLPPEIGSLSHLKSLYLDQNQLSGPVPPEIGKLADLQVARLGGNRFTSIPAELGNLEDLIFLELWGNQISGEVPGDLSRLTLLQQLDLNSNQFTGSIPPELGEFTNLSQLDLSHNQLSGAIPSTLGNLAVLNELDLSHNQLTGSVPDELGNLTSLYKLDLSYNELTGVVPVTLANASIADLRLWGNMLDGTIPVSEENGTTVEYQGVRFQINSGLAESVWREIVAAQPPSPGMPASSVSPQHVRFTIVGPREQAVFEGMRVGTAGQPQIMIFPTAEFSNLNEFAETEIEALQSLLESRPPTPANAIPYLPLINAAQVFHAQVKYIDFQNGSGVRFITQYSQDAGPITNRNIFYTFQGLTADGAYYVAASFPVTAEGLSDEQAVEDYDAFMSGYQEYVAETVSQLEMLPAEGFTPDLELIDTVIQSLEVNPP